MVTISKKFELYCDRARELALSSEMTFRHSTLVLYRKSIISEGVNNKFRGYVRGKIVPSMHSEIQAVLNLSNKIRSKPMTVDLFVSRFTRDNKPKISRPCDLCIKLLSELENVVVRKVYYFDNNSILVSENFKTMKKIYKTHGCKNFDL